MKKFSKAPSGFVYFSSLSEAMSTKGAPSKDIEDLPSLRTYMKTAPKDQRDNIKEWITAKSREYSDSPFNQKARRVKAQEASQYADKLRKSLEDAEYAASIKKANRRNALKFAGAGLGAAGLVAAASYIKNKRNKDAEYSYTPNNFAYFALEEQPEERQSNPYVKEARKQALIGSGIGAAGAGAYLGYRHLKAKGIKYVEDTARSAAQAASKGATSGAVVGASQGLTKGIEDTVNSIIPRAQQDMKRVAKPVQTQVQTLLTETPGKVKQAFTEGYAEGVPEMQKAGGKAGRALGRYYRKAKQVFN